MWSRPLGPLAGLVAITAACNSVNSLLAIIIGIIGSIIAIIVAKILDRFEIDDVVGAVPVHLAAGIWGTLAVGFFSDLEIIGTGLTRFEQIKVQIIGIASIGSFSFIVSFILLKVLNSHRGSDCGTTCFSNFVKLCQTSCKTM